MIINLVSGKSMIGDKSFGYFGYHGSPKDLIEHRNKHNVNGHNYVCMAYNRGHIDVKTGGHKWDWTTLMNSLCFVVQKSLPETAINAVDFVDDSDKAVKLIQWVNTDFIMFIVDYYKYAMSNPPVLFKHLPQPPASGDYSDESICEAFGLEMSDMEYIHKKMDNYGWKTRELIPDHKESSLLQFIDDLNNGKAKLPESKKGKKNTPVESEDSSPSGSVSSKTVLDNDKK